MKPTAPARVRARQVTSIPFLLVCAARTASAIVRLERISTQVLTPPRMVSR